MSTSVIEVLEAQHRRVHDLFERVRSPDEDRPAVLQDLLHELSAHVAAERSLVAPVVKQRVDADGAGPEEKDLADRLSADHDRMEKLMVLIERRKHNSPDMPELVTELMDVSEAHSDMARRDLFPSLAGALSVAELAELGDRVARADDIVSTHPHPHLLSLGRLSDRLTGVAAAFDRLRDRTVNNRHPDPVNPDET